MQLAEINLDAIIYLVLGLIWLIAQIASMAARGRRQQVKTAPAPPPDGAAAPDRTPTPAPARELRDFLQTLVSGESPPRPPVRSTPPAISVKDRERVARLSATPPPLRRDAASPPQADDSAVPRVTSMRHSPGSGLSTLRATPFPRMSMPPGFLMRQDRVSRSTDTTATATAMRRRASTPALREAILFKILLDPPRALTPPGGGSWWDPRRG